MSKGPGNPVSQSHCPTRSGNPVFSARSAISLLSTPYSLLSTVFSLRPTPYALLFTLYALLSFLFALRPTPYSLRLTPYALFIFFAKIIPIPTTTPITSMHQSPIDALRPFTSICATSTTIKPLWMLASPIRPAGSGPRQGSVYPTRSSWRLASGKA